MYYVYVHTVPNGKMYVGMAMNPALRWNGGEGYAENKEFYHDIRNYGWDKIKHEIIAEYPEVNQASTMESILIALLKTEKKEYGYNKTDIYDSTMKAYMSRKSVSEPKPVDFCRATKFFEQYNLPLSACEELINQWIFSEVDRCIAKDRLLNDLSIDELSQKYEKAPRTIKYIIKNVCGKLEQHL